MDEKTIHNNELDNTSDEHNETNAHDNTITIDDVLSTEERTLPNGNTITIIKRTTQTELIVPSGQLCLIHVNSHKLGRDVLSQSLFTNRPH